MRTYKHKIRNHGKNKRLGNMLDDLAEVHNHFLRLEQRYFRIYGKYAWQVSSATAFDEVAQPH